MTNEGVKYGIHGGRVASGMIILALGALMLLDTHNAWHFHVMRLFPGIVLILIGAARLLWGDNCRNGRAGYGGLWLVVIGVWLIANQSHAFGMSFRNSWPILIVAWGVLIVARELFGTHHEHTTPDASLPSERR